MLRLSADATLCTKTGAGVIKPDCEKILSKLREQRSRITPQRRRVLEILCETDGHISASEIYDQVQAHNPQVNLSTVYRILEWLESAGVVTRSDLGEGHVIYELAARGMHHHLVCDRCGTIIEVGDEILDPLRKLLLERYGFQAEIKHLAIHGLCDSCRPRGG